jgi:hypothetical protein
MKLSRVGRPHIKQKEKPVCWGNWISDSSNNRRKSKSDSHCCRTVTVSEHYSDACVVHQKKNEKFDE